MLSPDMAVVAGADQLGADTQRFPTLRNCALEDRADAHLATNRSRIRLFSFETEGSVSGHHLQVRELRQAVDEALGDAVAQVLRVRITAGVHERQHRHGVYCFSAVAVEEELVGTRGSCEKKENGCRDPDSRSPGPGMIRGWDGRGFD